MKAMLVTLLVLVLSTLVCVSGRAQGQTSSVAVRLSIVVGDRDPAVMQIPDNGVGTVTLPTGRTFGIQPHLDPPELEIRVLAPTGSTTEGAQGWAETMAFRVSDGAPARFEEDGLTVTVQWLGVQSTEDETDSQEQCCVTCQQVRYCACAVETVCADCCASTCCGSRLAASPSSVGTPSEGRRECQSPRASDCSTRLTDRGASNTNKR